MGSGGNNQPAPPPATPAIQELNTPTLFEKTKEDALAKWNAYEANPVHDIMDAPGMNDAQQIYGSADQAAAQDRLGNPAKALSAGGSADYANQLDSLNKSQNYNTRAEGLSSAYQAARSDAMTGGEEGAQMQLSREGQYASDMLNQQEGYYQREAAKVPLWQKLAGLAVGGLSAAGGFSSSTGAKGISI